MSLNSVNTNSGAMIALNSLDQTNSQLASVQKQISTGYRVADATDDGAAFAIAQRVRSDVGSLTSANQQLGNVQGLLSYDKLRPERRPEHDDLDAGPAGQAGRRQHAGRRPHPGRRQLQPLLANLKGNISDATYSGKTLIGNIGAGAAGFGAVNVVRNEVGSTYNIATFSGSALYAAITNRGGHHRRRGGRR